MARRRDIPPRHVLQDDELYDNLLWSVAIESWVRNRKHICSWFQDEDFAEAFTLHTQLPINNN